VKRRFHVSASDAGRALRTQRERFTRALEHEHLLLDDLGGLTDRAHEEL
jgi:hypothetical protein